MRVLSYVLLAAVILGANGVAAGEDSFANTFAQAKELYESAEYERALAVMDRIESGAITPEQARDRAMYAALCLLALDRPVEAETRIQNLLRAEPLFKAPSDTPPRLTAIIDSVRDHLMPSLVQEHYEAGKELFDRKDYGTALKEFTLVVDLTHDLVDVAAPAMRDVRVLAAGFRDLSRRALASEPSSPPVTAVAQTKAIEIEPPVVIRQNLPPMPASVATQMTKSGQRSISGVLELVIDAQGQVKSATLVQPIHPFYDGLLLAAAREWKYRAAMRNGQPVESVERLPITLEVRR